MVGGEKAQDNELKAKRMKRKKYMEKRKKILTEALKNVDDEDGLMQKVYDDIHEELKAKTDLGKKQKQKIKSMEKEVKDLTEEFQNERSDYLETIRKQDQQVKLLQAILERVQPTIRKDCNYSDLDTVKKEAIWDDEYMRWKVPDLSVSKTKLPPAGLSSNTQAQSDLVSKFNYYNGNTNNNNNYNYNSSADNNLNNTYGSNMSESMQQALRNPSQTAPARLGMWADEDDERILKQKLQRGEEEDIAGSYFRPKRAKELLFKYKGGNNPTFPERSRKSTTNNYNLSMSQGMLGSNMNNLNSSFSNTQGGTFSNSWAPGGSTGSHGISNTFGGSGGALNNMGNVVSNGWLGENGFSSNFAGGDGNLRRPNRLDALPSLDGRTKKKSRDVLHTLDLI
ncbi:Kinesin-like protein KIF17 [Armadillidium vulgare]|nr:Kinesin-like protein KIF17 [Armadillidium vulgare]